jgi:excisionase family DNA binding protein
MPNDPAQYVAAARFISLPEFAARVGVSGTTVWRWVRDGAVPAVRIGGRHKIRHEDAERMAAEGVTLRSRDAREGAGA